MERWQRGRLVHPLRGRHGVSIQAFRAGVRVLLVIGALAFPLACHSLVVKPTDRQVYQIIAERQQAATGIATESAVGAESADSPLDSQVYTFTPNPLEPELPESFRLKQPTGETTEPPPEEPVAETVPPSTADLIPQELFTPEQMPSVHTFGLRESIAYAMRYSRELQDAKEELYLAALDLSLERHLWTPQFVAEVQASYDSFAEPDEEVSRDVAETSLDRAMSTVSEVAVSQRLPFGGDVTARAVHTMVRDVADRVSKGDSGDLILSGNLPLLRGAGPAAYESRYAAEREMIYAIRRYERFRRGFVVSIASDYFDLQQLKSSIANIYQSYLNRRFDWDKADFTHRVGRSQDIAEAPRARESFRDTEARLVNAKELYARALDQFKIRIGMSVNEMLEVLDQDRDEGSKVVDRLLADVSAVEAEAVALRSRLDLLNSADQIDDARRGVEVAKNRILPDLNLTGSVTYSSDRENRSPARLREDRDTWQGGLEFRLDDRKAERNAYRSSLVALRRAQRDYEQFADTVRADVRSALRRVEQQDNLRQIQEANVVENQNRYDGARAQYDLGRSTNQDVVDAQNALLSAQNSLAAAIANYRVAILEFRRDTGTLRILDDGGWGFVNEPAPGEPDGGGP